MRSIQVVFIGKEFSDVCLKQDIRNAFISLEKKYLSECSIFAVQL